jgi:tetratricopeptide (TPR) repeat protein
MPTTREVWEKESVLPRSPSYEQMLEFFGIPPYSMEALDTNISKKRRYWHNKTNGGNEVGRNKATEVEDLIHRVSEALKRGAQGEVGGGAEAEIPAGLFETLEELWRLLSEYTFADEYDEALQTAREAVNRWHDADAAAALAWVVATGYNNDQFAHPALIAEGLNAAQVAVRDQPGEIRNWESVASLLMAQGRPQDAAGAIDHADQATGGRATGNLYLVRTKAMVAMNQPDQAMTSAIRAVSRSGGAAAIRTQTTDILVDWAATLLPIRSDPNLTRYTEMIAVAAWCSHGVPEAEDRVRDYRMWATNAGKRVFVGSDRMRSFLAVLTGFISLPIHNYIRSQPAWQVFNEGQSKELTDAFIIVAAPAYVQKIHNVHLPVSFQGEGT